MGTEINIKTRIINLLSTVQSSSQSYIIINSKVSPPSLTDTFKLTDSN